jgi:hypothetical protein
LHHVLVPLELSQLFMPEHASPLIQRPRHELLYLKTQEAH